eukprot:SAG11_NODE_2498_length_3287_cov_1.417817_1_plen_606_part_00
MSHIWANDNETNKWTALADFDSVISNDETFTQAWMEKAKILRRARKPQEALDCFKHTLELGTSQDPPPKGNGMHKYMQQWLERIISELEERILENAAVDSGEFGSADAADESVTDSGDGSGRWKVAKITGLSWCATFASFAAAASIFGRTAVVGRRRSCDWMRGPRMLSPPLCAVAVLSWRRDSCIYHLENHPPAMPHPYPNDAWHVNVRFGATVREYTPVSDYASWEQGKIDLLVKTYRAQNRRLEPANLECITIYARAISMSWTAVDCSKRSKSSLDALLAARLGLAADGTVSKKFALLRQASPYTALEEQPCWVLTSAPALTLALPSLANPLQALLPSAEHQALPPPTHIGIIVGGTGIAPAIQILREIALGEGGAFGAGCSAKLLYASRTPSEVLMLDELRAVEAFAPDRIAVRHNLTNFEQDDDGADSADGGYGSSPSFDTGESSIPGRHYHFTSEWNPYKPSEGELKTAQGEEAELRGRCDRAMLKALMPPPAATTRLVVSGPPQMWEDIKAHALRLGYQPETLVELESESTPAVAAVELGDGGGDGDERGAAVLSPSLASPGGFWRRLRRMFGLGDQTQVASAAVSSASTLGIHQSKL